MPKGFRDRPIEQLVEIAVKRMEPSAKRNDGLAFRDGFQAMQRKYGSEVAKKAAHKLVDAYPDMCLELTDFLPHDQRSELYAKAYEVMAELIESAGLRIEQHMRVSDKGIALTKEAVSAIANTGYPNATEFGEGNATIEHMGISRSNGFCHPLSEAIDADPSKGIPEDCLNLWALASMIISGAMGWIEANQERSVAMLGELVAIASPTTDLQILMRRSRYDDSVLLRLCALVHAGLEGKVDQAINI